MVSFEEAIEIVEKSAKEIGVEKVETLNSLGRILAEDIVSDMDMPPFDKSAMDGYACRYEDLANELEIIESIPAGYSPKNQIGLNQCSKIMTGAIVPDGADCVIMIEHCEELGNNMIRYTKEIKYKKSEHFNGREKRMLNICYVGEDIQKGSVVLKKGRIIKPQHIAMMAAVGFTKISVYELPQVAVVPTGNEIVEPEFIPSFSEIRNSNGYQLIAQLLTMGIRADYFGIARDTEQDTIHLIEKALKTNDILILTGGVSKGDFDLVPEILKKLDFQLLFEEISVQPGKPTVFGIRGNKYCFGLPGNPVSCFVQFELLVKALIYKMMNFECRPFIIPFPIANDFERKSGKRQAFLPVNINKKGEAELVDYHGSAHINGFNLAWGIMEIPLGVCKLQKGEKVNVRQI